MISFGEYISRELNAFAFIFLGIGIILFGVAVMFFTRSIKLGIYINIIGLTVTGIGALKGNKLSYERENEGARVYHYKGDLDKILLAYIDFNY